MFTMVAMFEDKMNDRYECMNSGQDRRVISAWAFHRFQCIFLWQSKNNQTFFQNSRLTRSLTISCSMCAIQTHKAARLSRYYLTLSTSSVAGAHALAALWAAQLITHHLLLLYLRRCLFLSWNLKLPALRNISSAISLSILTTFCAPAGQPEPAALTPPSHRNDQRQQQPSQFRTVTWQRRRRLV